MKKIFSLAIAALISLTAISQPPTAKKAMAAKKAADLKRIQLKQRSDSAYKAAVRKIKNKKTN